MYSALNDESHKTMQYAKRPNCRGINIAKPRINQQKTKKYHSPYITQETIFFIYRYKVTLENYLLFTLTKVKVGDKYIEEIDSAVLDYAYRHQLNLELTVDEAEKYLGNTKDPNQYEAEFLVGGTLIATPRPFPNAMPISVYCDDKLVIGYLLIRQKEILDDGTMVISNEEQKNAPFKFALKINIESKHSDISFVPEETITIKNMLAIQKILLNAEMGKIIRFKKLETDEIFLELSNPPNKENDLRHRQFRIKVLESILTIENYFKTTLYLPEQMSIVDCKNIKIRRVNVLIFLALFFCGVFA